MLVLKTKQKCGSQKRSNFFCHNKKLGTEFPSLRFFRCILNMKLLRYNKEPLVLSNVLQIEPISESLIAVYTGDNMANAERHLGYLVKNE